jgi:ATP-dependent RNA helicase RhlE
MQFTDFGLSQPVLRAIGEEGYSEPTPIQVKAIPHVMEGRDLLGCAQTGTGKTAAFALPIIERLAKNRVARAARRVRVLVLSPTRELASQIGDSFAAYGRHSGITSTVIFGGVNQSRQVDMLARGVDVLVATPGRLLDLLGQKAVTLAHIEVFVLDEADRMLDMGFIHDVRKIAAEVPKQRQTLLFSATMPDDIRQLANKLLDNPVEVAVTPVASTAEKIDQAIYFVEKADKRSLLGWILEDTRIDRALVFTRTKHSANRVAEFLDKRGIRSAAIHGNKSQNARERALDGFKRGTLRVLVATDIAARGIDIDQLAYVINFDLPNVPEAYVHRIGRTGRAGAAGQALSFCEEEERPYLADIERLIQLNLDAVTKHPYPSPLGVPGKTDLAPRRQAARPSSGARSSGARPANGSGGRSGNGGSGGRSGNGGSGARSSGARSANGGGSQQQRPQQAGRQGAQQPQRAQQQQQAPRAASHDRPQAQTTHDAGHPRPRHVVTR